METITICAYKANGLTSPEFFAHRLRDCAHKWLRDIWGDFYFQRDAWGEMRMCKNNPHLSGNPKEVWCYSSKEDDIEACEELFSEIPYCEMLVEKYDGIECPIVFLKFDKNTGELAVIGKWWIEEYAEQKNKTVEEVRKLFTNGLSLAEILEQADKNRNPFTILKPEGEEEETV